MTRRRVAVVAAAFLLALAAAAEDTVHVLIASPSPGIAAFGEVTVEAEAWPAERVASVDVFIDGRFVDRLEAPPYRVVHDVGEENREHRIEVVAHGHDGSSARSLLVTPALDVGLEVDVELQQLYVTVSRGDERVLDLDPGDFRVSDDGERQTLVTFERGDVPLAALLLVDGSASMRGAPIAAAVRGARAFVAGMAELDRAKLLVYADRVLFTTPFTAFEDVLTAGLDAVEPQGGTALDDHLYLALRRLEEEQGRRVIVLLSDGVDVTSVLGMEDVAWAAARSQALVYWIRLGGRGSHSSAWRDAAEHAAELERLERLVAQSGGRVVRLGSIDDTDEAFAAILRELREQYVLGYYPSVDRDDGSWHRVRVDVPGFGLEVRAREGYVDE